jgi:rubrerythrin
MKHKELKHILDMAIEKEKEAYDFYTGLRDLLEDPVGKDTLLFLAEEEKKHKEFLKNYREGRFAPEALRMTDVIDYEIAQYLEAPDIQKNMETKDVYLLAAHRELNSHNFYKSLAEVHPDGEIKNLLLKMASEELRHKEKMEYLYSNTAFPQTAGG